MKCGGVFVAGLVALSLLVPILACGETEGYLSSKRAMSSIQGVEGVVYDNGGCAYECTWGEGDCIWNWGGSVVDGQCGDYQVCCDIGNAPKPQCTGTCRYQWEGCGEMPTASGSCSDIQKVCCGGDGNGGDGAQDYYFVAQEWHGYGYTNVGTVSGGTITPITQNFSAGVNQVCVSGTLVENYSSVGLLGMNVDQAEGSDVKNVWYAGDEYSGVYIDITKNLNTGIRLELIAADNNIYCTDISSGASSLLWSDFATSCWGSTGTPYNPSIGFQSINLYAPGDVNYEVSFNYCLNDLYPIHQSDPPDPPDPSPPGKKWVGNITQNRQIPGDFLQKWQQITPENEGKWDAMEPSRDNMNWSEVDAIYKFAKNNGIPFKHHTFVWGSQQPNWIDSVPQNEQDDEVEEWIAAFCQRYPDVDMIDVVNEPDHATPSFINALGGQGATGYDWIIWSFQKARQHCPNAKLILNDYNALRWDTDNFIRIAKILADRGLLDGIGCQAHGLETQSLSELSANLDRVASIGVPIYISEYDVNIADDAQQRYVMEQQFTLFYNHSSVAGITLWGYIEGAHWRADAFLQHTDGSLRPALTWLMSYLGR